jgi:hypothetical protein
VALARGSRARRRPPSSVATGARTNGARGRRGPRPNGVLRRVAGTSKLHGSGVVHRFVVEVEAHTRVDRPAFAQHVERVLFSARGWTRSASVAFRRVSSQPYDFRVILASRATTDRLCAPALTRGLFSCHNDGLVVVNLWRWNHGADSYGWLSRYRAYVINHEVGHALGHGHLGCSGRGPAPVMMQQTIGLGTCKPNPWPRRFELS